MTAADRPRRGPPASTPGDAPDASARALSSPNAGGPLADSPGDSPAVSGSWALAWNLLGAILLIAAFKPLGLWPLAWFAFVPWLRWVEPAALPRRTYGKLYLAYVVACLGVLYWLTMAHWVAFVGWLALCLYLGIYLPIFIGLCRVAVHGWKWPLVVAAPILWMGLEYCRCTAMTGFPMGLLCHATSDWLHVIQIADLGGAYLVSGLMVCCAAGIASAWPTSTRGFRAAPLIAPALLLLAAQGYGLWRVNQPQAAPEFRAALIQGDRPETTEPDDDGPRELFKMYHDLSKAALTERPELVLWPETIYRFGLAIPAPTDPADPAPSGEAVRSPEEIATIVEERTGPLTRMVDYWETPALLGLDLYELGTHKSKRYNAAALIAPDRGLIGTYAKVHLVPFGEYIPFGETFPWIYEYTPLGGGLSFGRDGQGVLDLPRAGKRPVRLAVSICFETTVPHRTRAQIAAAYAAGAPPDVIANVTNDGWFHGSAELDVHLACGVYRAVEMRTPLIIAANTGLSANVDANGRVLWQSERMKPVWHIADVAFDSRDSLYLAIGDWPVAGCLAVCLGLAIYGVRMRRSRLSPPALGHK